MTSPAKTSKKLWRLPKTFQEVPKTFYMRRDQVLTLNNMTQRLSYLVEGNILASFIVSLLLCDVDFKLQCVGNQVFIHARHAIRETRSY